MIDNDLLVHIKLDEEELKDFCVAKINTETEGYTVGELKKLVSLDLSKCHKYDMDGELTYVGISI